MNQKEWEELRDSSNKDICHFCKKDLGDDGTAVEEFNVCLDCAEDKEDFIWEG